MRRSMLMAFLEKSGAHSEIQSFCYSDAGCDLLLAAGEKLMQLQRNNYLLELLVTQADLMGIR
jgi:hypothetical protein